jgi:hypothetical protein
LDTGYWIKHYLEYSVTYRPTISVIEDGAQEDTLERDKRIK